MAKMTLKKKAKDAEKKKTSVRMGTPGNPHATLQTFVEKWRAKSSQLYLVELDGAGGAVLNADDKLQARERFFRLFGITGTDKPVKAVKVSEDEAEQYHVDCNGVIDYKFNPKANGRPKHDDETDEDDDE